ncbi:MAG: Lrp/AsnC family transcriptional regulator [Hellea sp.]|nr:Lrp/AsnC family transcriptional regulator [Hellea sp.]
MTEYRIDDLDQQIIELLSTDARLSNRKIASELGFTEGTIRSRVKRLEEENFIRFTAVTNMSHLDRPQLAYIGIHAEQAQIRSLAKAVAKIPEINGVIILLGRFDILAIGLFEGLTEVHRVASNQILDLPGVRHVETTVAVDVVKYNNRLAKIIVG